MEGKMSELITREAVAKAAPVLPASVATPLDPAAARAFARELVAAFRRHPHINNVLTHVARGRWDRVEAALAAILAAPADGAPLPPLERNLLELVWGEAGVTGRIVKPLFLDRCRRALPAETAEGCLDAVAALFARHAATAGLPHAVSRRA
jgi:hypothetical protein